MSVQEKMKNYVYLMRFDKPVGILLLLWPTLWALWLAGDGQPSARVVWIFVFGVILMRSAGCIVNDIVDRDVDPHVERTKDRPLASGQVSVLSAMILLFLLLLMAFFLVCPLNKLTIILAVIGAILACTYPFLKRITHLPQVGLGLAFSWGVPMAFAALTGDVPKESWILFASAAIWPVIYDTFYAMVDQEDDKKIGVKSTAILFGKWAVGVTISLQVIFLFMLGMCGSLFQMNFPYYLALVVVGFLFSSQNKFVMTGLRENYFKAFLNNQWVGFFIFAGIFLSFRL